MPFFNYRQNNSGGSFADPAIHVYIEAENPAEADYIAVNHGVYFNGVEKEMDCDCCGDRWATAYGSGESIEEIQSSIAVDSSYPSHSTVAACLVVHADGRKETFGRLNGNKKPESIVT